MADDTVLDNARQRALDDMDYWGRATNWFLALAGIAEIGLGVTFICLLDFSDRLHVVLFFAVLTVYVPIVLVLLTLWCNADRNAARILRAVELLHKESDKTPG